MAVDALPGKYPVSNENWFLPVQLGAVTAAGAGIGILRPDIAGKMASHGEGAVVGAALGVGAGVICDVGWFLAITG